MISKRAGPALILIGVLLIGFTALLVDASHGIFEPEAFAERAASSLADPRVSEFVANKITDGIISARPNLKVRDKAYQSTALDWALHFGHEEIVRLLR